MYSRIPDEMKNFNSWICWKLEEAEEGKATKIPYSPLSGSLASVNDPNTWVSYEEALSVVHYYSGLGFVLSDNDPFTFIDLDEPKNHLSSEEKAVIMDRQIKIYNEFNSYSEISPSGQGLHIIVKGRVKAGRKRSSVEVYSNLRFMTMTGNVYKEAPIENRQELLNILWEQMGGGGAAALIYSGDEQERYSDEQVINMALNARNGDLFNLLREGRWREKYQSQSEADYAYVDILAFYTQNRQQITRLFRNSALGQRPKALRVDYTDYMINKSFDRMLPPVDVDGLKNAVELALAEKAAAKAAKEQKKAEKISKPKQTPDCTKNRLPNFTCEGTLEQDLYLGIAQEKQGNPYQAPPGLVGDIARFIYAAAPRPVPEIALAGALSLMAGICGRSYNISNTGLNQYILLLARTGRGKEAIAKGINKLISAVKRTVPAAGEFIGPAEISSPQALIKYMCKTSPSFVSVMGEVGLLFKQLTAQNASSNLVGLRRNFLDIFNKSGEGDVFHPIIYSEREKNTEPLLAPAFTMIGETTPKNFFEALSETSIEDGLLPRFTIIQYEGIRVPLNEEHANAVPSFQLVEQLSALCAHSLTQIHANKVIKVDTSPEAKEVLSRFDKYCDLQINSSEAGVVEELWNRAHIKALKIAALVCVGVNPYQPVVCKDAANWAINIVVSDIKMMLKKFETGEVGLDQEETKQIDEVCRVFKHYLTSEYSKIEGYKASTENLHSARIVTLTYVHRRLAAAASFRKDRIGATNAIHRAIKILSDCGDIREIPMNQIAKEYGFTGKCYAVVNLSKFKLI